MRKKISQDLQSISDVIEQFNLDQGKDKLSALREALELTKKLGVYFNQEKLYIAFNEDIEKKMLRIKSLYESGTKNHLKISKITGIPRSSVTHYIIKMGIG